MDGAERADALGEFRAAARAAASARAAMTNVARQREVAIAAVHQAAESAQHYREIDLLRTEDARLGRELETARSALVAAERAAANARSAADRLPLTALARRREARAAAAAATAAADVARTRLASAENNGEQRRALTEARVAREHASVRFSRAEVHARLERLRDADERLLAAQAAAEEAAALETAAATRKRATEG
ncbi:hypothetical protein [Cryptosporangium sp. NPDC048952]|uniref:hypothetical protein n=1 Tax=Cryptosporangium sp. NPDC048952 TaxID=3363961 RepID=UPI0037169F83